MKGSIGKKILSYIFGCICSSSSERERYRKSETDFFHHEEFQLTTIGSTGSDSSYDDDYSSTASELVHPDRDDQPEIWKSRHCSRHRILLVGEGDFSFSACLARTFGSASNIIASSLDSQEFLRKNYRRAMANIEELSSRGCIVLHGVDATKIAKLPSLKSMEFDRIIFNFPHSGFFPDESADSQICRHQKLIYQFLTNARELVAEDGEIHISHKTNGFHLKWDLEGLGNAAGLELVEEVPFDFGEFPGYRTKYGFGGNKNFHSKPSSTYIFGLP